MEKSHVVCLKLYIYIFKWLHAEKNVTAYCLNLTQSNATKLGNEALLTNPSVKCSSTFLGHKLWRITPLRNLELQEEETRQLFPFALHIKALGFHVGSVFIPIGQELPFALNAAVSEIIVSQFHLILPSWNIFFSYVTRIPSGLGWVNLM